jgi:hypothetical protein
MITFQVQTEMTDEAWADHVFGSGAFMWEWWADAYQNPSGDVVIKHWYNMDTETLDEEHEGEPHTYYTRMQAIADAASDLATESKFVRDQLANDDFDADGMDRVVQYLVFGEVLFA